MNTKQQNRWSDEELQIIKDVFKDKEFIYAVRDVMMGFSDTFELKTTEAVLGILRKNLLPEFSADVPLMRQQDLCHISLEHIAGFNSEQGILRIKAFDIAIDYLERRFGVLEGEEDRGESLLRLRSAQLSQTQDDTDRFVRMLAYLQIGGYIEKSLNELSMIADYVEPTAEELQRRQQMGSNK